MRLDTCTLMWQKSLHLWLLTPKGLNVHGVTKPVLGSVTWSHTIFRLWNFCEDASCHKFRLNTNFIIFGSMDQKLWVFEVFGQGLARVGLCWSQRGVDQSAQNLAKFEKKNGRQEQKRGTYGGRSGDCWSGAVAYAATAPCGQPMTNGRLPAGRVAQPVCIDRLPTCNLQVAIFFVFLASIFVPNFKLPSTSFCKLFL
jgi:hypothetical protein